MAVVVTIAKGYDLGYIWKTQDHTAGRTTGGYYIDAAQAGEPPGRWWGPGAQALGLTPGQTVQRRPYDAVYRQTNPRTGARLGQARGRYPTFADHLARLQAAEPHATAERLIELERPQIHAGAFELAPRPRADARWLDVTPGPGRPAVRADLTAPAGPVQVTREQCPMAAAGLVLHRAANRMLAYWQPDRRIVNSQLGDSARRWRRWLRPAACPPAARCRRAGRLAALCEQLGVTGHEITAAPRRDLPEPWRSVAACHLGENPGAGTQAASAPAAVVLPELDGARYAVAGLHTGYGQTWLHVLADGTAAGGTGPRAGPSWWLRDDTGPWHAAVVTAGAGTTGSF